MVILCSVWGYGICIIIVQGAKAANITVMITFNHLSAISWFLLWFHQLKFSIELVSF